MNKITTLALCSLISSLITLSTFGHGHFYEIADDLLSDMKEMNRLMERTCNNMVQLLQEVDKGIEESEQPVSKSTTKRRMPIVQLFTKKLGEDGIQILCKGISSNAGLKAIPVNKKLFSVQTQSPETGSPEIDILIRVERNILSVIAEHEEEHNSTEENNASHSYGRSKAQLMQDVPMKLNLEAASIDYDREEEILAITIPRAEQDKQDALLK